MQFYKLAWREESRLCTNVGWHLNKMYKPSLEILCLYNPISLYNFEEK